MEEYKVTEEDLIGQLEGFPIEIVQKMVERQVEQRNPADVTVFQKHKCTGRVFKGFEWVETDEGIDFWNDVIRYENFHVFFEKYPKEVTSETEGPKDEIDPHVYYRGVWNRGDEIISELEKLGGKNDYGIYNGKDNKEYYFINPKDHLIRHISAEPKYHSEYLPLDLIKSFYTEKFLPEVKPDVKSETIEIDGKKYNKKEVLDRMKELKEVE